MLRINGEITSFLNDIEFETKEEFMEQLRTLRKQPNLANGCDYEQFYKMIGVAIQQAYYTNPNQLVRYKNYCKSRKETGVNYAKTSN
jgi:hypothetical protein